MLSDKIKDRVSLICYASVSHLFAMMHNSKYRGENFSWDNFPEMAKSHGFTQCLLQIRVSEKNKTAMLNHAEDTAFEIATNLVKWMRE